MGELDGRVALVTGAGSGIGSAIAQRLGAEGAKVAVNYFHAYAEEANALAKELGGKAYEADVSSPRDAEAMTAAIAAELGPLRILVNNAGIEQPMPVSRSTRRTGIKRSRSTSRVRSSAFRLPHARCARTAAARS